MANKIIETVKIGNQLWQKTNLDVLHFNNGDEIPFVENDKQWEKAGDKKMPACCIYKNDETLLSKQGVIYNWYAIMDPRGIAPDGFRLPSIEDWVELAKELGGVKKTIKQGFTKYDTYQGIASKLKSNSGWDEDGLGVGTDDFGFCVQPFGNRDASGPFENYPGSMASFWSTDDTAGDGNVKDKNFVFTSFFDSDENDMIINKSLKGCGKYVRCIKI